MPHSTSAYSAGETAAFNSDFPLFVSHNVIRDAIDARWTTTGTQTGADLTSPIHYAYRAWDGRGDSPTRAYNPGATTTIYLNIQVPPSTIDTCAVVFLTSFPSTTVTVQIANDAAFTSGVVDFAGPFAANTGLPRSARSFAGTRYIDVEYIRIRFVKASGDWSASFTSIPKLVEFFIGHGRILSIGWGFGSDIDPVYVQAAEFEARSGDRTRYIAHRGRHRCSHSQVLSAQSFLQLDDPATARAIADESFGHTRPVLYIPRPSSQVNRALLGYLPEGGLDLTQEDFDLLGYRLDFDELPLYRDLED